VNRHIGRREFLRLLGTSAAAVATPSCRNNNDDDPSRYTPADIALLARQRADETEKSGKGPFGRQRYRGYRGLAELPWFELDGAGVLHCVADDVPQAIDMHCHFGISVMLAPDIDLQARTPRVQHLLDCDAPGSGGCDLDLDVYINANFSDDDLRTLQLGTVGQGLWGSSAASTQTIPNLLAEMDSMRVERSAILPITFGFPFGDDLCERWLEAIDASHSHERFVKGASVHPRDPERISKLERYAAAGARLVKLHPTMQRFYPDDPSMNSIYEACDRLGLAVFFHCGRAGIEPEPTHRYALPRHYEAPLANFPNLQFVLGHGGARDQAAALELAPRYENAWLGIHGQGVTWLSDMIRRTGGERLLFGTDWPFYHLGATLAKVLIVTEGAPDVRGAILRRNAERLLGGDSQGQSS